MFLIELGLREFLTLKKILELSTRPKTRSKAFNYFIDNFKEKYSKNYDLIKISVAFLPCLDQNTYVKPLECYINPKYKIMKFQVICQDLQYQVGQFGVRQHPSREKLLNRL